LDDAEVQALLGSIKGDSSISIRNRAILAVMLWAGLRTREVCALMREDVDLEYPGVHVQGSSPQEARLIPVDERAMRLLQKWDNHRAALGLENDAPFFCGLRTGRTGRSLRVRGQALKPRYVQALVGRLAKRAGIQETDHGTGRHRVTPGLLRHTYAAQLLREGCSLSEVQLRLGDTRFGGVKRGATDAERRQAAAAAWATDWAAKVGGLSPVAREALKQALTDILARLMAMDQGDADGGRGS
jgi:integrase